MFSLAMGWKKLGQPVPDSNLALLEKRGRSQPTQAKTFSHKIVTQVVPLKAFYPAEAYHQDFVKNNPDHSYVVVNAIPKLQKLKKTYGDMVKKTEKRK